MQAATLSPPIPPIRLQPPPFTTEVELFERELDDEVLDGASQLMASDFDAWRLHAGVGDLAAALHVPAHRPALRALAEDVAQLARAFAASMAEAAVDVRLERITDDACRAFHRDRVRMRLVTTYVGPGTQYVGDAEAEAALRLQGAFAGELRTCRAGALAWMRGAEAGPGCGLVHRSPPIAATGRERLFLAVGAPSPTSPVRWTPACAPVFAGD